ncbi:GntP family permease [Selenomonas sp. TAMA-11512]|uniref:GntP family permease n=1 Tax=Selenomonas sp. TAMA-11512 TaxID=3095337 RepID=UPI0030932850|nr:GntP family permease [Selenomonas sp. TAMA-11512]
MDQFIITIVVAVAILCVLIIKLNVHPVLALFITGITGGLMLNYGMATTISTFTGGFGSTLGAIGCTIIFGSIIAQGIRDTGSAKSLVNFFVTLFRGKNLELSTGLSSYIMSIPVFGDIVQVLMAPISSTIAKRTNRSMSTMSGFTILGSSLTHSLVPPTPGILAVSILLGAEVGLVIFWGIVVTFIAYIITWILMRAWVSKEWIDPMEDYVQGVEPAKSDDYRDILIKEEGLPNVLIGVSPVIVPVILITAGSFANIYLAEEAPLRVLLGILGERNIALFIGVLLTFFVGLTYKDNVIKNFNQNSGSKDTSIFDIMVNKWVAEALHVALIPLLVTAMGGGFSAIIKAFPGIKDLAEIIVSYNIPTLLVPFVLGAVMMTAVGSRTTAGMTAAGICVPMMATLGLSPVACALLIGAGTMVGSHFSDSGFWVGTSLFNLTSKQGLKYLTLLASICGIFCFAAILACMTLGFI